MKKTGLILLLIFTTCTLTFSSDLSNTNKVQDDLEDKIALSKEGGTTRAVGNRSTTMGMTLFGAQTVAAQPEVEAYCSNNVVTISILNYRGGAWVEIYGAKGAKQTYIEVYDMGFDVISMSGLGADEYNIRITLGSEVFSGTFNKGKNGHYK